MLHLFREVSVLRQEGKIHKALIVRVIILLLISLILTGVLIFNIIIRNVDIISVISVGIIGFILGLYVFSRMNIVNWNEEEEIVQAGKMDTLGYGTIILYLIFEIGLRTFFNDFYPLGATILLLSVITGTLLGRTLGIIIEIHKVFNLNHPFR